MESKSVESAKRFQQVITLLRETLFFEESRSETFLRKFGSLPNEPYEAKPVDAAVFSCRSLPSIQNFLPLTSLPPETCNWVPLRGLYAAATYPRVRIWPAANPYSLFLVIIRLSSQANALILLTGSNRHG